MTVYRTLKTSLVASAFLLGLAAQGFSQAPPIRIMPLGDSITDGSSFDSPDGTGGYRGPLYNSLTTAGYNVDYVGSLTINSQLLTEQNHEGHSGWTIGQLDSNMQGWLDSVSDPDVVLMHIGTNDTGASATFGAAIDRLDALILKIATLRPYCHIIVTNLMERGEPQNTSIQTLFNPYVQARVDAHALAGRRVTFLDMRAACPITDMPDSLHPDQNGYNKMAAAWLPAIQAVIGPNGDNAAPAIARARGVTDATHVAVTFSKPIADYAANPANFSINGLTVTAASLDSSKRIVTLTTSPQTPTATYTVTVNNVLDRLSPTPNSIAANSTKTFLPIVPRGYLNNVPESTGYTLVTSLDVPNAALWRNVQPTYSVDNRNNVGPFDRVAYYLELQTGDGQLQYMWASMNAFTTDVGKLSVPTVGSGAQFQQSVSSMNVVSNAAGIVTGTNLTGNLEFWPTNYAAPNTANVPGANGGTYDFGDQPTPGAYGSMQLHNAAAGQTLFALNNWGAAVSGTTGDLDLGIGNDPTPITGGVDWTFHHNAATYSVKTLQVLVRTSGDIVGPTIASAAGSFGRTQVFLSFNEPVSANSISATNFTLSNGVTVLGATVQPNLRDVTLLTTTQPAATTLTLTVSEVRDASPNANKITPNSTVQVPPASLPAEISTNVGAPANGYQLVYSANLPIMGNFVSSGAAAYSINDSAALGTFTRIAYYLELQTAGGQPQYVWASMDAFSINRNKIGIPTVASGAIFQQNVTNLDVKSNVAGVVTGITATGGNIEFWPQDYSQANGLPVTNANAAAYDFGDTRITTAGGNFGCLQIHNHDASQTVLALNHFGADGNVLDVGIGNQGSGSPDWTFAANAANYTRRVLHVLVLPGATTPTTITNKVPEAANYQLVYSLDIPNAGNLTSGTGFVNYAINNSAEVSQFSRVAYYMELQKTGDASPRYAWVSMNAFTNLAGRIGVPSTTTGAFFQQNVGSMNVFSNVAGVTTGSNISTGNIEFWPSNYSQGPTTVPNANISNFDWGDGGAGTAAGYGSMQVHNYGASQTIFALNHFGNANESLAHCVGIGNNSTAGSSDWTFADNSAAWDIKKILQVYVLPGNGDLTAPTISSAVGSTKPNRFVITFSEPVADTSVVPANFSIPGLTVQRAELLAGQRDVAVYTSPQTAETVYTVNVTGIRDRTTAGNLIANGASTTFTAYSVPAVFASVPETAGYELIYRLAIPSATPQWNVNTIPYNVNESKYGEQQFDRVGYLLQLDGNWVYASFDRHTNTIAKIGVPTLGVTASPFQQLVTNLNVASNVGTVTTGTSITTGNIEFWGGNYAGPNTLNIPNANGTTFDFGDQMSGGGHGSMQIHNYGASQVIMAYNNWGSNTGQVSDTGIGNYPSPSTTNSGAQLDWTFSSSASSYTTRNLYVFARNGGTATGTAPTFASHPISRLVNAGASTTLSVVASGPGPLTYQWRKGGAPISGATNPWLELTGITTNATGDYDVVVTGSNFVASTSLPGTISVNSLPTFTGYGMVVVKNTPATVSLVKVLAKTADADADPLSISTIAATSTAGGTISQGTGNFTYTPANNFTGADTFGLTISDGRGGLTNALVDVVVVPNNGVGMNQANITLTPGPGQQAQLQFYGIPHSGYEIQRSTNLQDWTVLGTVNAAANGEISFTDPAPPGSAVFYRTKPVP